MTSGRWLGAALLLLGCQGVIADSHPSTDHETTEGPRAGAEPGSDTEPGGTRDTGGSSLAACEPTDRGLTEGAARRLSRGELVASLSELLGAWVLEELADELALLPSDRVSARVTEFQELHAADHARAVLEVTAAAAEAVAADPDRLTFLAGPCTTEGEACIRELIRRFGRRAWRRPLEDEEVERYYAHYASLPPEHALEVLLMRILGAPDFLFHLERGTGETDAGRTQLTGYEVASRIAYRITGAPPDDLLLNAAGDGELVTVAQAEAQARRLLETDRGRARARRFFRFWLDRTEPRDPHPGAIAAAGLGDSPLEGLSNELLEETLDFIDHVIWEERGSVEDLFLSRAAFPRTETLASIYGTPVWSPGEPPVETPAERQGLMLRAGMLVGHSVHDGAVRTTPILRGVFVRRRILCDDIAPPDPELVAAAEMELEDLDALSVSNREWVEELTSGEVCQSCHSLFNPLGFVLEGFGPLGRLRMEERVFDGSGSVLAVHPLDTAVEVSIDGPEPQAFEDAGDLVNALATSSKVRACIAKQIFRFYRLREEQREDRCVLSDTLSAYDETETLVDMIVASVANEDLFWKRTPQ